MILLAFTFSGLALLALQVAIQDCRNLSIEIKRDFGHDTAIFPDYLP